MADRQAEMRLMLRGLRLPAIAAVYEDLALKAAKANLTHEEFLYELLRKDAEVETTAIQDAARALAVALPSA